MASGNTTESRVGGRTYTNGVLTVVAALLGVSIMQHTVGLPGGEEALAQRVSTGTRDGLSAPTRSGEPTPAMGIPNAADQRARMISTLDSIEARLGKIESRLSGPMEVRVLEMPEMKQDAGKPQ